ncbi:MAG: RNA repair transcriptional activator RtcR family protein [Deltaproteobacteria bacterium]
MKIKKYQKVLLSFIGNQDPRTLKGEDGPILTFLREKQDFDRVILFYTPDRQKDTLDDIENTIRSTQPKLHSELHLLPIHDPTNHEEILSAMRPALRGILEITGDAEYYISISSGTPAMHACWILLAAGGEIPANILHKREERFVKEGQPVIAEINPRSREFPHISPNITMEEIPGIDAFAVQKVREDIGIIGNHPSIKEAIDCGIMVAHTDASVLIRGESGTGKELFAQFIHHISKRCNNPFIPVNCGGLPETLIESELFGYEKGAFTGATQTKSGKFELANGGTLFLDEIGDMSLSAQVKILRSLNDKKIDRIGGKSPIKLDVRIIAATNRDLEEAIREKAFREDLYHRLNVVPIYLPPLRERKNDIAVIALHFLKEANQKYYKNKGITPNALQKMQGYHWKGNARELKNVIKRLVITSKEDIIDENNSILSLILSDNKQVGLLMEIGEGFSLEACVSSTRQQAVVEAMRKSNGNQAVAAKLLGISPQAISKYLQKHPHSLR